MSELDRSFLLPELKKNKKINIEEIFGNKNPLRLEIGCGHGEFLCELSERHPDRNFIGFELKRKRIISTIKKLKNNKRYNVRIAEFYVDENIEGIFSDCAIDRIYINHPDPWPKKRHHKKRLIQTKFVDILAKLLTINGIVQIATDHLEYSKWIMYKFSLSTQFESVFKNGYSMDPIDGHIVTHFEIMKRKEGFEPIFMHFRRTE